MIARSSRWQLQEAKNKLSEVIRRAREEGPQTITQRGEVSAILLSPESYMELCKAQPSGNSLADFFLRWSAVFADDDFELDLSDGPEAPLRDIDFGG